MPIDILVEGSPGWWLARLSRKLEGRRARMQELWDRYEGDAPIPKAYDQTLEENYKTFRKLGRVNFAEAIVNSRSDRMQTAGFRTSASQGLEGDPVAQQLWDANSMDVELSEVVVKMLVMADSYTMVGLDENGDVAITAEDAREVVTIHDPVRQRVVRAGLKLYHDPDEGRDYAYLHLPAGTFDMNGDQVTGADSGRVWVATRKRKSRSVGMGKFSPSAWDWSEEMGGELGQKTKIKRVPIVRFRNKNGMGEFEPHTDLIDGLDQGAFEKRVVSAFQAWRQRAVMVPDGADEDDKGKPIDWQELLSADPGATWTLPEDTKFWESALSDLRPQIDALQHDIRVLADVTSTPMRSFHSDAGGGSAEGAASQRENLVFRVEDRLKRVGEGLRDTLSIGFELNGDDERAKRESIEVLWLPADRRSLAEQADAWSKTTGLPFETRCAIVFQMTPAQIAKAKTANLEDAITAAMATPAALPAGQQRELPPAPIVDAPALPVAAGAG